MVIQGRCTPGPAKIIHLQYLQKVEEPSFQIILEGKDQKMTIREVRMSQKWLIRKVPGYQRRSQSATFRLTEVYRFLFRHQLSTSPKEP